MDNEEPDYWADQEERLYWDLCPSCDNDTEPIGEDAQDRLIYRCPSCGTEWKY